MNSSFLFFGIALVLSLSSTPLVAKWANKLGIVARPNNDVRTHTCDIPLLGGIGILAGVLPGLLAVLLTDRRWAGVLLGLLVLLPLAFYKDRVQTAVAPWVQLFVQLLAIGVLSSFDIGVAATGSVAVDSVLTVLLGLWIINGLNFLDVVDGLAAGVAGIASMFFGIVAWSDTDPQSAIVAFSLAGACFGFLGFNHPPARIFMGDSGSFSLGLILAALLLSGRSSTKLLCLRSMLLFLPLADLAITSGIRLIQGRAPTTGGGEHIPIQLLNRGWKTSSILALFYSLAFCIGIAVCFGA